MFRTTVLKRIDTHEEQDHTPYYQVAVYLNDDTYMLDQFSYATPADATKRAQRLHDDFSNVFGPLN